MKVCVLVQDDIAEWVSCRSIQGNLITAYRAVYKQIEIVETNDNKASYADLVSRISNESYDKIILLDYRLNISLLFSLLDSVDFIKKPVFTIHVYGDFVLRMKNWDVDKRTLEKFNIDLICASSAQKKIIGKYLIGSDDFVSIVPFPVSQKSFFYEKDINKYNVLKMYGLSKELSSKEIFLYTGRISFQKNIFELMNSFKQYNKLVNDSAVLILVGSFDNIVLPYQNQKIPDNFYQLKLLKNLNKNILFIEQINQEELQKLYCIADMFTSLSTYNDEDYGMSVAEALMCGLPCTLTQWGGFNDFLINKNTLPVSVIHGENRLVPSQSNCVKQFLSLNNLKFDREEFAKQMSAKYSIGAASELLQLLTKKKKGKWVGSTDNLKKLVRHSDMNNHLFSLTKMNIKKSYSQQYYEIYDNYLED